MEIKSPLYLALGANLGDARENLEAAIGAIGHKIGAVVKTSDIYLTRALSKPGSEPQPDYLNMVVLCRSTLSPFEVLEGVKNIESSLGRLPDQKGNWAPRQIDIDIVAYGDQVINTPELQVPHPHLEARDFVLYPLFAVDPGFVHPLSAKPIAKLIADLIAAQMPLYIKEVLPYAEK